MFKRILVANRGEIACRVIRTARALGVESVAVYSEADRDALHVAMADEAVHVGPAPATESYLDIDAIVAAAEASGAEAVHPGYGFLSESPAFAQACADRNITFIGPSPEAMRKLGLKDEAKRIAVDAGVPIVPGYFGAATDAGTLTKKAAAIGFPLMVKAVAGGGGRGMRVVPSAKELTAALESAAREAGSSFGDKRLMLEKLIDAPRHIEVQVFGDHAGNVVHMFERDCSLQRRHQKVVEEAPAPGMSAGLRTKITDAAVKLAKVVKYAGAGTVEFLVDGGKLDDDASFFFIEMNTRLQVEHPVTEAITGLDLVEWQLRIAAGESLPLAQGEITATGHAIEARLYAEDPAAEFQPSVGKLHRFDLPVHRGLRIETGVRAGDTVTPHYDPMLAKIISSGKNRDVALSQLANGIEATAVLGVITNTRFLLALCEHSGVRSGIIDTGLIGRDIARLNNAAPEPDDGAIQDGIVVLLENRNISSGHESWNTNDAFQLGPVRRLACKVIVDGTPLEVVLAWSRGSLQLEGSQADSHAASADRIIEVVDGRTALVWSGLRQIKIAFETPGQAAGEPQTGDGQVRAPITGRVSAVDVAPGAAVANGDRLLTVEAMKMEHIVSADLDGIVDAVHVVAGDQVTGGDLVVGIAGTGEREADA